MNRLLFGFLLTVAAWAADITGKWDFQVETSAGSGTPTFTFQQKGEVLTGTYSGLLGEQKVTGTVKGDDVEFTFTGDTQGTRITAKYKGKLKGADKMEGKLEYEGFGDGTWSASRQK